VLFPVQYEDIIIAALKEDLGRAGDLTSQLTILPQDQGTAAVVARQTGQLAGLEVAARTFELLDSQLRVERLAQDGQPIEKGQSVLRVAGPARSLLAAERTALNFLGRMCGIATATSAGVAQLAGTRARLVATRKTTPGLRCLEKWAVVCGGGLSHRFGLDDGVLIKDNHVALAGGVVEVLRRVEAGGHHLVKVELEVDTLEQLQQVLQLPNPRLDVILLDNFRPEQLRQAVAQVNGRYLLEASGGLTLDNLKEVAQTGVDLISLGSLTHSVRNFDLGLDMLLQAASPKADLALT
jgi:nicotinate-nucleotide pyrophosphorylase (carboxylating)